MNANAAPSRWRRLWILPPLAIGIGVLAWQAGNRQTPERIGEQTSVRTVRVVEALRREVTPIAVGYGVVQPARVWTAVARVSGRIVEMSDDLGNGSIVTAGSELLRIDPVDYELELARIDAELAEIDARAQNTRASLEIDQRNLVLAQREFDRISGLMARGTTSQSEADAAERSLLGAHAQVQGHQNTLALIPAQRKVLEARRAQALRDIKGTRITAPFNMRVAALEVAVGQHVGAGQRLLEGDSMDRAEVVAQVSMAALRNLVQERDEVSLSAELLAGGLSELVDFSPLIELDLGNHIAVWEAEFVRMSDTVDPETRTIGVVLAVDDPVRAAIPGARPPLSKGMFVTAVIRGRPLADRVVVPRHAVRAGTVLLADDGDRLRIREVRLAFEQENFAVIAEGLEGGERVIVSDVVPLVANMPLAPIVDDEETRRLAANAGRP